MNYYYFCTQLPFLQLNVKPPFDPAEFERMAGTVLTGSAAAALAKVAPVPDRSCIPHTGTVYDIYYRWETTLRSEIARLRIDKNNPEWDKIPQDNEYFNDIPPAVAAADGRLPLEREEIIEKLRWDKLNELEFGREFSLDFICIYKLKLLMLQKKFSRDPEEGRRSFDALVDELDRN